MAKARVKLVIAFAVLIVSTLLTLGAVAGIARLLAYFNSGADPSTIFLAVPTVPVDLKERVTWLPDLPSAAESHDLEPYMRERIASAYLYGWAQLGISYELKRPYGLKTYFLPPALDAATLAITSTFAAGWQVHQSNLHHTLELAFYSDDGSIVAFTDRNAHLVQQVLNTDGSLVNVSETTNVYDVVMRMDDGLWRIRDLVRRGDGPPLTAVALPGGEPPAPVTPAANFVRVQDHQLTLAGQPFTIAGINYYPQASPWTQFWPQYKADQTVADLDLIRQLHLNTVRIFISYEDFGADRVQPSEIAKLTHFLDQAQERQLKVIVTIFDHHTDHHVSTWAGDDRHLAGLIPPVANHPAILAWDIKNEPNRDYDANTQELVDAWLRHIARTVRRYDPNHLITIGWSQPEAATALTDIVDFVSFHYFEDTADYSARLTKLLAGVNGKPVLLQEFVMSTWNSFWPHGHTEGEQAHYYADLLRQHRTFPTAGYMVWTLHDFDSVPLAEFRWPWQRATQANMGLLRHDSTWKPAAAVIIPGAALNLPPLPRWYRWTKPFWLMMMVLGVLGLVMLGVILWWWRRRRPTGDDQRPLEEGVKPRRWWRRRRPTGDDRRPMAVAKPRWWRRRRPIGDDRRPLEERMKPKRRRWWWRKQPLVGASDQSLPADQPLSQAKRRRRRTRNDRRPAATKPRWWQRLWWWRRRTADDRRQQPKTKHWWQRRRRTDDDRQPPTAGQPTSAPIPPLPKARRWWPRRQPLRDRHRTTPKSRWWRP